MSLTVFRSSAGSGKTFTLVQEYLKIALTNTQQSGISDILALTFTNKASNEMKERIIAALLQLADSRERQKSPHFELLLQDPDFKLDATEIAIRSQHCLTQLLHNYSSFSVQTIDRFIHRIIRTFASELNLSQTFEVELDESSFLKEVVENLVHRSTQEESLSEFLAAFALARVDADKNWRIEMELVDFSKKLLKEDAYPYVQLLSRYTQQDFLDAGRNWESSIQRWENEWKRFGTEGLALIEAADIPHTAFFQGRKGVPGFFEKLARGELKKLFGSYVNQARNDDKWYTAKTPVGEQQKIDGIKDQLLLLMKELEESMRKHYPEYTLKVMLHKNLYQMGLLQAISQEIERLKDEKNVVLISDFNRIISRIVSQESAPFIYERTAQHYQHFLIDEFQDTSTLQWQNLVPLIENSLASGGQDLIVGDGKQAIYRWRGGDVDQFVYLPRLPDPELEPVLYEQLHSLQHHIQEHTLGKNYRSCPEVVRFNNELFERIAAKHPAHIQDIYKKHEQEPVRDDREGYVEVRLAPGPYELDEWHAEQVPALLKQLREEGYAWKDMAVLCRKNKDLSYLASILINEHIPVVSSEALLLFRSLEVKLLHAFVKVVAEPHQVHRQIEALSIWKQIHSDTPSLHESCKTLLQRPGLKTFSETLQEVGLNLDLTQLVHYNGNQLVETLLQGLGLDRRDNAYLSAYLNQVHHYFTTQDLRLIGMVRYLDERRDKLSLSLPEGAEAVSLMTIHQSKGLEYPIVLFAYANWRHSLTDYTWLPLDETVYGLPAGMVRTSKDLEETPYRALYQEEKQRTELDELNLLYVALTRAAEQLYVFTWESPWLNFANLFLPALKDMEGWQESSFVRGIKEPREKQQSVREQEEFFLPRLGSYPEDDRFVLTHSPAPDYENDPLAFAQLVKESLSRLNAPDQLEESVQQTYLHHHLSDAQKSHLRKELKRTIETPEFLTRFCGDQVINEVELQTSSGEIYRPDRLVKQANCWHVIDCRAGEPSEKDRQQIVQYKHLLSTLTDKEIQGWILYTDRSEWMEV